MNENSLMVSRVINADINAVYKAWTDPEEMIKWYSPDGMRPTTAESNAIVGGGYSLTMHNPQENLDHVVTGEYLEIQEPGKIVFSWKWSGTPDEMSASKVTVSLEEIDSSQTKVTIHHENLSGEQDVAMHTQGWEGTLLSLEKHFS